MSAPRVYTLIVCPVCGEQEAMDYTIESMALYCEHVPHEHAVALQVVPAAVADALAELVEEFLDAGGYPPDAPVVVAAYRKLARG